MKSKVQLVLIVEDIRNNETPSGVFKFSITTWRPGFSPEPRWGVYLPLLKSRTSALIIKITHIRNASSWHTRK